MHKSFKYIETIIGIFLIALSFDLIIDPMEIVIGGTSGIAVVLKALFNINTSLFITIFYIAMLLINLIIFGKKDTIALLLSSIIYPIFINILEIMPDIIILDYNNKLLLYVISGVLMGIGSGLIYKNGFICGGTDVIKKIMSDKMHVTMGTSSMIMDSIIVISGGFIFGINSMIYAIIIIYIVSNVTDRIILGISNKKMFYIMTKKPEKIKEVISNKFNNGITEIDAVGGYSGTLNHVLMTVINTKDYIKLKTKINEIDDNAFFLITDAYHTYHGKR